MSPWNDGIGGNQNFLSLQYSFNQEFNGEWKENYVTMPWHSHHPGYGAKTPTPFRLIEPCRSRRSSYSVMSFSLSCLWNQSWNLERKWIEDLICFGMTQALLFPNKGYTIKKKHWGSRQPPKTVRFNIGDFKSMEFAIPLVFAMPKWLPDSSLALKSTCI